jgi:hypothetical protein
MGQTDEREVEERQRIEQQLKDEVADLDLGEDADQVVGGVTSADSCPSCGPVAS